MLRAVVGPVTPVKVGTQGHGELEFHYRDVEVFDESGAVVARFVCEDTPEDFDEKAKLAGYRRTGFDQGSGDVLLDRVGASRGLPAASGGSAGDAAVSLAGNLMKLAWMAVLMVVLLVVLFGCAAAMFGGH